MKYRQRRCPGCNRPVSKVSPVVVRKTGFDQVTNSAEVGVCHSCFELLEDCDDPRVTTRRRAFIATAEALQPVVADVLRAARANAEIDAQLAELEVEPELPPRLEEVTRA